MKIIKHLLIILGIGGLSLSMAYFIFLLFNTGDNSFNFDLSNQEFVSDASIKRITIEDDNSVSFLKIKGNIQHLKRVHIGEMESYFDVFDGRRDILPLEKNRDYEITNASHFDAPGQSIRIHINSEGRVDRTSRSWLP